MVETSTLVEILSDIVIVIPKSVKKVLLFGLRLVSVLSAKIVCPKKKLD